MERSATDIIGDALTVAVLDAVIAWKASAGGLTNVLARELGAVHVNTTLADLPREVQVAIAASVRDTFKRLLKEDYVIRRSTAPAPAPRPGGNPPARDAGREARPAPRVEVRRPRGLKSPKGPSKGPVKGR